MRSPGERPPRRRARTIADELPESHIDVALHAVIWEPLAYRPGDMRAVAELGVGSVKLWLAYVELGIMADDDVALRRPAGGRRLGMVVLAHCENGRVVDVLTRRPGRGRGRSASSSLPRSRPIALEAECVHRFLALAEVAGATPYVVHVTGARPLEEITAARERGMTVHAEACPHHLLFDASRHEGPGRAALRDDAAAAHAGRPRGAPARPAQGRSRHVCVRSLPPAARSRQAARAGDFTKVPTGLPGIGARLPLGFGEFVAGESALTPERLVDAACAAPARIFGLYPRRA